MTPRPHGDAPRNRRNFLALGTASLALAACGFTPVYGPSGQAHGLRGQIFVADPADRNGFVFVAHLEDRLGQPQAGPYLLEYRIQTSRTGLGVTTTGATTRYNVLGRVDYTIKDRATGAIIRTGKVENFTGYSATGSIVGTVSATEDASERLMVILADQLVTELIATAPDWRG
ncbi:LPS assembly lipoprotein LptE [Pseudoruegeria sp. HB172150]|uniref:LPS assembly lipoprotein LptE n=1 Tax=Pseudoruegeria sp. HB172150 TaxID=2721164 RepID=UPI0020A646DA|nr:LPS assembly lipoprotein LptE [Pseudoruegeria sp. HB172150]